MDIGSPRVRFAPSPTGMMHLGNVRTALLNYLFAQQQKGTFVLRIEDTDPERNFDPSGTNLMKDLTWLELSYDEGPGKEGTYGPYLQSQRNHIYQQHLEMLKEKNLVYRCFCTPQELEKKRQRAIALKIPPRYDRTCLQLSKEEVELKLAQIIPFIWRFKIEEGTVQFTDMARGTMTFNLSNFSDFPLNRADGSFTFIFANCIDDMLMRITHVLRGEDHLSNTTNQIVLYQAFKAPIPLFWHLPIICNVEGKKLSKRDFGFSLNDLRNGGFLPEAINNYLAIIGGSFDHEIMDLKELAQAMNFTNINTTGCIRYDVEKLKWINHKWIQRISDTELIKRCKPLLEQAYPSIKQLNDSIIGQLINALRSELTILTDIIPTIHFYFNEPSIDPQMVLDHIPSNIINQVKSSIKQHIDLIQNFDQFIANLKEDIKPLNIPPKAIFTLLRLALTESTKGPSLPDIVKLLGPDKVKVRLERILT